MKGRVWTKLDIIVVDAKMVTLEITAKTVRKLLWNICLPAVVM